MGTLNNEKLMGFGSRKNARENHWTEYKAQTRVVD